MKNDKGQSLVEFLITLIFSLGFVFLFVRLAFNQVAGLVIHYATYMSARTYLVWDEGSNTLTNADLNAVRAAKETFDKFNLRKKMAFSLAQSSPQVEIRRLTAAGDRRTLPYVGAYYRFKQKITIFDFLGGTHFSDMLSEAFLGKEPPRGYCMKRICEIFQTQIGEMGYAGCGSSKHDTLFDNGC